MRKFLSTALTSLLVLGTLSSCSSSTKEAPVVVLPDVSSNTSTTPVTPAPVVPVEENTTEEETETEEEMEDTDETELVGVSSATIDYSTTSAKIIQVSPHLIIADDETDRAMAIINEFEGDELMEITVGALCEISYVDITYPDGGEGGILHEIGAYFIIPITQGEDKVGAFMDVIRAGEESLSDYSTIAVDLSDVSNLNVAEKEALLWSIATEAGENTTVIEASEFTEGVLFKLSNNNSQPLAFDFEKITWHSAEESTALSGSANAEIETGLFSIVTN